MGVEADGFNLYIVFSPRGAGYVGHAGGHRQHPGGCVAQGMRPRLPLRFGPTSSDSCGCVALLLAKTAAGRVVIAVEKNRATKKEK